MFSLNATPNRITSNDKSDIRGNGGTPPYSITASGMGSFIQTDTEGGMYTPVQTSSPYIVTFWAGDANNALARCDLRIN